jgi:hypothetical protein
MDKKLLLVLIVNGLIFMLNAQTTYYVSQEYGNDTYNGESVDKAFKSLDGAINVVLPGDTIKIIGVYKNSSYSDNFTYTNNYDPHLWHAENTIRLSNLHGNDENFITIKPYDKNTLLKGDGANIFRVQNCSYLRIEGFVIEGEVKKIPLSTAKALQFIYIDEYSVTDPLNPSESEIRYRDKDCIANCVEGEVTETEIYSDLSKLSVIRPSYIDTRGMYLSKVHHIDILNNQIHHMPGGGLRVSDGEDIKIIGNEVHNCSRKSYSGTHALVVTKATSTRETDDYRLRIEKNKVHHNYNEQYSWSPAKTIITPHIDEGKGISLQRNQTTYNDDGSIAINWEHGRILVANNICFFNGFSGVHSNDGNRIDMINNTCYFNSYTKSITTYHTGTGGNIGISAQGGKDVRIINNISIIDSELSKSAISSNISSTDGLVVENNLIYGTTLSGETSAISEDVDVAAIQVNTFMMDPLFTDPENFDFSLHELSPARMEANSNFSPTDDFYGNIRGEESDLGAVEYLTDNTGTIDPVEREELILYPNPASKFVNYRLNGGVDVKLRIYDLTGNDVTHLVTLNSAAINISDLPAGLYLVKVQNFKSVLMKL